MALPVEVQAAVRRCTAQLPSHRFTLRGRYAFEFCARSHRGPHERVDCRPRADRGVLIVDQRSDGVATALSGPQFEVHDLHAVHESVPSPRLRAGLNALCVHLDEEGSIPPDEFVGGLVGLVYRPIIPQAPSAPAAVRLAPGSGLAWRSGCLRAGE